MHRSLALGNHRTHKHTTSERAFRIPHLSHSPFVFVQMGGTSDVPKDELLQGVEHYIAIPPIICDCVERWHTHRCLVIIANTYGTETRIPSPTPRPLILSGYDTKDSVTMRATTQMMPRREFWAMWG